MKIHITPELRHYLGKMRYVHHVNFCHGDLKLCFGMEHDSDATFCGVVEGNDEDISVDEARLAVHLRNTKEDVAELKVLKDAVTLGGIRYPKEECSDQERGFDTIAGFTKEGWRRLMVPFWELSESQYQSGPEYQGKTFAIENGGLYIYDKSYDCYRLQLDPLKEDDGVTLNNDVFQSHGSRYRFDEHAYCVPSMIALLADSWEFDKAEVQFSQADDGYRIKFLKDGRGWELSQKRSKVKTKVNWRPMVSEMLRSADTMTLTVKDIDAILERLSTEGLEDVPDRAVRIPDDLKKLSFLQNDKSRLVVDTMVFELVRKWLPDLDPLVIHFWTKPGDSTSEEEIYACFEAGGCAYFWLSQP